MTTVELKDDSKVLTEVKSKITLLRGLDLDVYFLHIVDRAEKDMNETVELANQLKDLEDDDYIAVMEAALTVIDSELEDVMERQRNILRAQLASLNDKYVSADTHSN